MNVSKSVLITGSNAGFGRLTAEALARNGFRRGQTAAELGITTRTLYNKIKKYGLQT